MIVVIFWLFPMCTQLMKCFFFFFFFLQLMKCAAGDVVPSLIRLKKHGSELKFFVSIFGKLNQINNIKSRKVATFKNCEIFSNYCFSYLRDYKDILLGRLIFSRVFHIRGNLENVKEKGFLSFLPFTDWINPTILVYPVGQQ